MAEEDQDQKSEQATGKRLSEARERGQLPISREVSAWVLFVAILIVVAWLGPLMTRKLVATLQVFIESPHQLSLEDRGLQTVVYHTLVEVGLATFGIFAVLAAAAFLGVMIQTGPFASLELLQPDLARLSPARGIKRLLSVNSLVELGKSMGKLLLIGSVVYYTLYPVAEDMKVFTGHTLVDAMLYMHHQAVHLIIMLLLVFTVIAVIDFFYQRFQYMKGLRMSKTEVKEEFRQQEGDPMIKARLRQMRAEKARKRMMAQVPKADVIITNPTHYAVAMQYDNKKMTAPMVLAKGTDQIAERIRLVAEEHKIPLISNPPLARALYDTVDIDEEIPTQHYRAVAEIISFVYKLKKKKF
jgi:flagellar biosynthetic protein FlhB